MSPGSVNEESGNGADHRDERRERCIRTSRNSAGGYARCVLSGSGEVELMSRLFVDRRRDCL